MFKDENDCFIGLKEDYGDSCHRTGHIYTLSFWFDQPRNKEAFRAANILSFPFYRRSWRIGWWNNKDRFSRDQATAFCIMCAVYGFTGLLYEFYINLKKRYGFFWNTSRNGSTKENHGEVYKSDGSRRNYNWKLPDFAGPEFWGILIRGLRLKRFYVFLFVSDLQTLISAVFWRFRRDTDVLNHLLTLGFGMRNGPTFLLRAAVLIMKRSEIEFKLIKYCQRVGIAPNLWLLLISDLHREN